MSALPETGYLRLSQIIGQTAVSQEEAEQNRREARVAMAGGGKPNSRPKRPRPAIPGVIPIGKSKWWAGVASGKYPRPTKALGPRVTAWMVEDVRTLIRQIAHEGV